ncbi:sigma-70 family RNA polymerase sigma factor [Candidatus Micrarchaeota archaeon]|nr:sigma-70 family RNA polymerase sigma factor [Candidatus Micrarchaeota archaeon]
MDKAWKRVHTVEDLAKELNMYHSMAWTLLKRTFGDKYGATGKIFIEPEDYQQLTSFPEVREYAADKNVPPERVAEVIESLKKTKGKQKSKGLINRAKTLILLEHLGFTPGTPEHSFLFKRKIGHEKLERHAELLTSLGVTNLAAFRHYLLKPHDYLKKPETKKAIKKCQSLLTLEEVREYAKKKNTPQEKTAQIIGVLEEEMRKRKIDSLVGKGAIRKLYRFNARGKKIVLLEHLGIQPHQPAYGLFFGNKSSAETMEKKAETLKELGVTDFYKFRFYLYSGRINLEDPKVVSLVRKRLNPTSATPAFDETSIAHDEIGKLMQKANSGNNEAFNKLIATFTPFIKKTAGELFDRKTGPSFEDLQAFGELGVYNAVRSIKHLTNPKAYLFSAIKNTMRRCIREERTSTTSIFQPIESKKLLAEGTKQ